MILNKEDNITGKISENSRKSLVRNQREEKEGVISNETTIKNNDKKEESKVDNNNHDIVEKLYNLQTVDFSNFIDKTLRKCEENENNDEGSHLESITEMDQEQDQSNDNVEEEELEETYKVYRSIKNDKKGDMINNKETNDYRLLFQNINSLRPQNMEKWKATIERINHLQCDIVGLCETCVNWSNKKLKQKYEKLLHKTNRNSNLSVSSCEQATKRHGLPGGTATMIVGRLNSRIIETLEDKSKMGRWSGSKIRVSEEQSLYYITAYRVCDQKS
jgi:hypothetical protein